MTTEQRALFCVWAGEGGRYADAFVKGGYVAIGWPEVQDLHRVDSYNELRARLQEAYPHEPPGRIRNYLGQVGNFILSIGVGDFVVTPDSTGSLVYVGEVISHPFKVLNADESCPYPHRRKVEWLSKVRRSELSKSMQHSLRSPQAVFRIGGAGAWLEAVAGALFPLDWSKCPAVESVPGRVSGAWVFTGTRLPVSALFGNLAEGATIHDFIEWFGGIDEAQVRTVLEFVVQDLDAKVARAVHANPV